MKGIYFQKEFQRFYPDNEIAAQVLGYVGVDDNGLGGLEEKFDGDLHGRPGLMYTAMDARRKVLGSTEREPEPGRNLVLTIDENIQFMAERALDHAMEKTQALNGTVVVQDVHTGPDSGARHSPHFQSQPVSPHHARPAARPRRERRVRAGLDLQAGDVCRGDGRRSGHARRHDRLPGRPDHALRQRDSRRQGDRGLGTVTVATGAGAFERRGRDQAGAEGRPRPPLQYIRAFGFGQRSGVELPGETRGLLRPVNRWRPASIGSVAIGQEDRGHADCNWFRWFRQLRTAACTCRRTC